MWPTGEPHGLPWRVPGPWPNMGKRSWMLCYRPMELWLLAAGPWHWSVSWNEWSQWLDRFVLCEETGWPQFRVQRWGAMCLEKQDTRSVHGSCCTGKLQNVGSSLQLKQTFGPSWSPQWAQTGSKLWPSTSPSPWELYSQRCRGLNLQLPECGAVALPLCWNLSVYMHAVHGDALLSSGSSGYLEQSDYFTSLHA